MLNAIGLANVGLKRFLAEKVPLLRKMPCPVIVNVAGHSYDDYTETCAAMNTLDCVAAVDARRIAYIAKMLMAAEVESRRASARAAFMYWAYLGQAVVMDPRSAAIPASAMDEISELFESS